MCLPVWLGIIHARHACNNSYVADSGNGCVQQYQRTRIRVLAAIGTGSGPTASTNVLYDITHQVASSLRTTNTAVASVVPDGTALYYEVAAMQAGTVAVELVTSIGEGAPIMLAQSSDVTVVDAVVSVVSLTAHVARAVTVTQPTPPDVLRAYADSVAEITSVVAAESSVVNDVRVYVLPQVRRWACCDKGHGWALLYGSLCGAFSLLNAAYRTWYSPSPTWCGRPLCMVRTQ